MSGYSSDDRFTLNSDGTLNHYNTFNKVLDSLGAYGSSVGINIGAGYGLGVSVEYHEVDVVGLIKSDLVVISFSMVEGFDMGKNLYASIGFLDDAFVWDDITYESYLDSSKNYSTSANNVPNKYDIYSVSAYPVIGANIALNFNQDYFDNRIKEIWG